MLPLVPLVWAARAAGHEALLATTSDMTSVAADAGLSVVDVFPERDVWQELMAKVGQRTNGAPAGNPFGLFTETMTEGTIAAGRDFDADLVVYTSDHAAGRLTARALDVPALEVGNRVSWSARDAGFRGGSSVFDSDGDTVTALRAKLGIPEGQPRLIARIDPRAPSMGGIAADEPDVDDRVPWWPMRYVPFNGGAVIPDWARTPAERPRIAVTLGTVVPVMAGTSNLSVTVEALAELNVEVVLAAGKVDVSGLGTLPPNVRSVGYLPLSTFLPTCAAIVHHGGSGTTAAPLHYGVPQLVMPAFADNPLSAQRVVDRGVGLSLDPSTADAASVRALVRRLLDEPAFAKAAREVSAEMATQPSPAAIIERVSR
jgi:UDP:flavonoid glycosyltransferase YjiC (YdhE family)